MSEPKLKYDDARVVDCRDLDDFVNMHLKGFGLYWRSLDTGYDGYNNGSYEEANPVYGMEIEDQTDQDFDRWLMGGSFLESEKYSSIPPSIEHMLQWLCNMGAVDEGKYVVHLWW